MTIDELKDEFVKLYGVSHFDFNTPIYKNIHNQITEFIYENHLEDTDEWKKISCITLPRTGLNVISKL